MSEIVLKPGKKKPNILSIEKPQSITKPQTKGDAKVDDWLEKLLDRDSRIRPGFADAWVSLTSMDVTLSALSSLGLMGQVSGSHGT